MHAKSKVGRFYLIGLWSYKLPRGAGKCTSSWEGLFKTPSLVSMWESVS